MICALRQQAMQIERVLISSKIREVWVGAAFLPDLFASAEASDNRQNDVLQLKEITLC